MLRMLFPLHTYDHMGECLKTELFSAKIKFMRTLWRIPRPSPPFMHSPAYARTNNRLYTESVQLYRRRRKGSTNCNSLRRGEKPVREVSRESAVQFRRKKKLFSELEIHPPPAHCMNFSFISVVFHYFSPGFLSCTWWGEELLKKK